MNRFIGKGIHTKHSFLVLDMDKILNYNALYKFGLTALDVKQEVHHAREILNSLKNTTGNDDLTSIVKHRGIGDWNKKLNKKNAFFEDVLDKIQQGASSSKYEKYLKKIILLDACVFKNTSTVISSRTYFSIDFIQKLRSEIEDVDVILEGEERKIESYNTPILKADIYFIQKAEASILYSYLEKIEDSFQKLTLEYEVFLSYLKAVKEEKGDLAVIFNED